MKDPESDMVDVQSLSVLSTSPSYVLLLKEVHKLFWIELDVLASDEDKMCFFTNILNILLSHAAITEIATCSSTKGTRDLSSEDHSSGNKSWEDCLPRLDFSYCRTSYLKKYGYIIGKLGFVRYEIYSCALYMDRLGATIFCFWHWFVSNRRRSDAPSFFLECNRCLFCWNWYVVISGAVGPMFFCFFLGGGWQRQYFSDKPKRKIFPTNQTKIFPTNRKFFRTTTF